MTFDDFKSKVAATLKSALRALRHPRTNWSLHLITYPLLLTYFIPVLVICWVAATTQTFLKDPHDLVLVARAIAGPFFDVMHSTLAAIFVPFVMAYAVRNRTEDQPIPFSTLCIFFVFLGFFVISTFLYGLIEYRQVTLSRKTVPVAGKEVEVYVVFSGIVVAYAKEALTYIALVLGIALRPAMNSAVTKPEQVGDSPKP